MEPIRIIVTVRGGCIEGVYSSSLNVVVDILDRDNQEELGSVDFAEVYKALDDAIETMHAVY